jgi:protocatechuate 3,4-dioxygenase beta subunit
MRPSLAWLLSLLLAAGVQAKPAPVLTLVPAGEPGQPLVLTASVVGASGRPVAGARVHAYQTDATGVYTRERAMDEPHARLAGWVTADSAGRFELRTIRPGGYPKPLHLGDRDRHIPAHIHLDVTAPGHAERRFQAVFADDTLLADPYWKDWVRKLEQPVVQVERAGTTWHGRVTLVVR